MDVLADARAFSDRGYDGRAEVLWVWAREPDALDARHRIAGTKQLAELGVDLRTQVTPPRVHVLSEECNLADAGLGKVRDLRNDFPRSTALFASANGGDDAVRTG